MKLKTKLLLIAIGPLGVAVVILGLYSASSQERAAMVKARDITPLALEVVGPNLALDDVPATTESLKYLQQDPDFRFAVVRKGDQLFAQLGDAQAAAHGSTTIPSSLEVRSDGGMVTAAAPIKVGSKVIGGFVLGLQRDTGSLTILIVIELAALLLGAIIAVLSSNKILATIHAVTKGLGALSEGDLTQLVPIHSHDEIGKMSDLLNASMANLRKMTQDLSAAIQTIATSSSQLSGIFSEMAKTTTQSSERVSAVATAAEELSATAGSVAEGTDRATSNLSQVSNGVESITSTLSNISGDTRRARDITEKAAAQAAASAELIRQLGSATREVGEVTNTIAHISAQTNLLALNATIESARAGAAGKGFAVVAGEIKELAHQTASATVDIARRIEAIQASTKESIEGIEGIANVNREVTQIVSSIADAIEKESQITQYVAESIVSAVKGVADANQRIAEFAPVTRGIASDSAAVSRATGEVRDGGQQALEKAAALDELAQQLTTLAARFKV